MIEFRSVALIALWTLLIGPVLDTPFGAPAVQSAKAPPPPAKAARR